MTPLFNTSITLRSILYYSSVSLSICGVIAYTLFQARFLIAGPNITFINDVALTQNERVITLEGTAHNIVKMKLNGRQIYTDKSGYFKEAVVLENGYTIATVQAQDRYGRIQTYTKEFVHTPSIIN